MIRAAGWLLWIAILSGCGRDSGRGETCQRTDDCAEPMRCVRFTCVDPNPVAPPDAPATHPGVRHAAEGHAHPQAAPPTSPPIATPSGAPSDPALGH